MDTTQERDEKHSKTYDEQKAYLDFYNKILEIKDEQIIPLKEAVGKLRGTVYIISLIGIVFFFILGILGLDKYNSIKIEIEQSLKKNVDEAMEYYNSLGTGCSFVYSSDWKRAIPYLQVAVAKRPYEEVAFWNLMICYVNVADIESGGKLYEQAEKNDLFKVRFKSPWTFYYVGRLFLLKGLQDSKHYKTAIEFLDKAEHIASEEDSPFIIYFKVDKVIIEVLRGNVERARRLGDEIRKIDPNMEQWAEELTTEKWYREILKKDKNFPKKLFKALSATSQ